ncbi:reverse transcriptase family protein [Streptomyces sp. WAC05374]|uniref:reverse transcriptase family protein n=2 Tax=Streptomyces sp. WAC05374 TaxID=2487420 RepID=UPI002E11B058
MVRGARSPTWGLARDSHHPPGAGYTEGRPPIDSPALYRSLGRRNGVTSSVIDEALEQMRRVRSQGLTPVLTLGHLAHQTGAPYLYLRRVVQRRQDPYTEFSRPKRERGKSRTIAAPAPVLMDVQRWLLTNVVSPIPAHGASYAYQQGRSAVQCAQLHLGASWLLKFDLHDFFHSVNERTVQSILRAVGYNSLVSFEMARVCTRVPGGITWPHIRSAYQAIPGYSAPVLGYLPQGAPASGALANLAARPMDEALSSVADRYRMTYTRYADDMTFSTLRSLDRSTLTRCVSEISAAVSDARFRLHRKKTRVVPPGARKIVLGLLVDGERLRLPRHTRRGLEDHVRGVAKFGIGAHVEHAGYSSLQGFVNHIDGLLAYGHGVDPAWSKPLAAQWEHLMNAAGLTAQERRLW